MTMQRDIDEREFVARSLAAKNLAAVAHGFFVGVLFNVVMLGVAVAYYTAWARTFFITMHVAFIAIDGLAARLLPRNKPRLIEALWGGIGVAYFAVTAGAAISSRVFRDPLQYTALFCAFSAVVGVGVFLVGPLLGRRALLLATLCAAPSLPLFAFATEDITTILSPLLIVGSFIFAGAINRRMTEDFVTGARHEFQLRSTIAPAQVVRLSIANDGDISERFKPRMLPCVCVCSDWRAFQKASQLMTPENLAATLRDYYSLCDVELARAIPRGNYFYDWIADELFIVVFVERNEELSEAAAHSLAFCKRMLEAKADFLRNHLVPQAYDFGIASGTALVGMMGADASRKATAIGEVCGRSRRLQTVGKSLRSDLGNADRIVFGADVRSLLPTSTSSHPYLIPGHRSVRDLASAEVFFVALEPQACSESRSSKAPAA